MTDNEGYKMRKAICKLSAKNEMFFSISTPLTNQSRLLLPNIEVQVLLYQSSDAFRSASSD